MQKIITLPHCRLLVVEVPEDAVIIKVFAFNLAYKKGEKQRYWETIRLPAHLWQILGTWPDGITEEQAGKVVALSGIFDFETDLEALKYLLAENGIEAGKKQIFLIDKTTKSN